MKRDLKSLSTVLPTAVLCATLAVACAKGGNKSHTGTLSPAPESGSGTSDSSSMEQSKPESEGGVTSGNRIPCQRLEGTWVYSSGETAEDRAVLTIARKGCHRVTISSSMINGEEHTKTFITDGSSRPGSNSFKSYKAAFDDNGALVIQETQINPIGGKAKDCLAPENELLNSGCSVQRRTYSLSEDGGLNVTEEGVAFDSDGRSIPSSATYRLGESHVQPKTPSSSASPIPIPSPSASASASPKNRWAPRKLNDCGQPVDEYGPYCNAGG